MKMKLCVFLSSSEAIPPEFIQLTRDLGTLIGSNGDELIYGGTNTGTMGILAESTQAAGGKVTGIIPQKLYDMGKGNEACDELIISKDLRDRKGLMDEMCDAFIALPGGLGTLEEVIEIFNLKYLQYHEKPVIFINFNSFYEPLFAFFETLYTQRFTKKAVQQLYHSVGSLDEIYPYLEGYKPVKIASKWYDRSTDSI